MPRRKRRRIGIEGRDYFWFFSTGRDGGHQPWSRIVIQASEGGQLLLVPTTGCDVCVTPAKIRDAILTAAERGWPARSGKPLVLSSL